MGYGTKLFDPWEENANIFLDCLVRSDLVNRQFFTREDLLSLPLWKNISTATRYAKLSRCVRYWIERKKIVKLSFTDLALSTSVSLNKKQTDNVFLMKRD